MVRKVGFEPTNCFQTRCPIRMTPFHTILSLAPLAWLGYLRMNLLMYLGFFNSSVVYCKRELVGRAGFEPATLESQVENPLGLLGVSETS